MVDPLEYSESPSEKVNDHEVLMRALPIIALAPSFVILYYLDPASFEATWKGRTFYLFFLWLVSLEIILNWDKVQEPKISKTRSAKTAVFITVLLLPTLYVVAGHYFGLNIAIVNLATKYNVDPSVVGWMSLSTEYLVLTALFALMIYLEFGIWHLKDHALSTLFLATIGIIYTIDNFYPNGQFTPFQFSVPITAQLAANFLNMMGYRTGISPPSSYNGWTSVLSVVNPKVPSSSATLGIAWPCAGVESLIVYTVVILIFLKGSAISLKRRTVFFAVGAIVTYFINILRIATIFIIQMNTGGGNALTPQAEQFHVYFGQLYSITWIMLYPLMIVGSQILWNRVKIGTNDKNLRDSSDPPPLAT